MSLLQHHPYAVPSWSGELPLSNRYTFGLAGERFFRALKENGQIMGTRCPRCDRIYVPAVAFCERCFHSLDEWVDLGTTGEIGTYTLLTRAPDGSPLDKPELIAFIQFGDGGLIHRLSEVDPHEVYFGMPVEAVFKPAKKREGSILDIRYFRPI